MYSFFLGNTKKHMPVWTKNYFSLDKESFKCCQAFMSLSTVQVTVALVADVSLVSNLQEGNCAIVSTPARLF